MAYAGDRLYNEVIRKMMADLASRVKVREILAYLPCLTLSDREEIEAKRETAGNYTAMMLLLDNLRRRQNWPEEFISALRSCEQWALANEISEAYDRIRGNHTQRRAAAAALAPVPPADAAAAAAVAPSVHPAVPPAPVHPPAAAAYIPAPSPPEASATVTMATIHNAPHSTPPLLTPSMESSPQSATPPPAPINSHPGPYSNTAASCLNEVPALVSAPDVPVHPPPESAHPAEPTLSVLDPNARPPSPVSAPALTPSIGQSDVPVSSGETSKQGISGASAPINSSLESCSNIASPALTGAPALVSAQEDSVHPSCEPAHPSEPPFLVLAPHAIPPSPVSAPKVTAAVVQSEVPVGSRESPKLATSGGLTYTTLSGPSLVAAPTHPTNPISTDSRFNKCAITSQSSAPPEKSKVPVQIVERSSSVKHPIQDTNPPGTVPAQDSQNNPTISQVVERVQSQAQDPSQGTAQASPSTSADCVAGRLSNFAAENEENFSKPGVLRGEESFSVSSDHLQISHMTTESSPIQPARRQAVSNNHRAEEPVDETVSVTTDDLMISSSTTSVPSQCVSVPTTAVQNSFPRALENGLREGDSNLYPNQPVEDHYESFYQSLQRERGIRMHVVEVSEEPSVQNLEGQPPSIVGPTTAGLNHSGETESLDHSFSEDQISQAIQGISQFMQGNNASEQASPASGSTTCAEPAPDHFQESESNVSGQINIPQSEQREESQGMLHQFQSNLHLVAAVAIGLTAVFVALRHRC